MDERMLFDRGINVAMQTIPKRTTYSYKLLQ